MNHAIFATSDLIPLLQEVVTGHKKKMRFNGEPYSDDPANNKPMLWLVKDQGLYLMTNLDRTGMDGQRPLAYAMGCHPDNDEDWYETARSLFGGDDGAVGVPLTWASKALENKLKNMTIELSEDEIKLHL